MVRNERSEIEKIKWIINHIFFMQKKCVDLKIKKLTKSTVIIND